MKTSIKAFFLPLLLSLSTIAAQDWSPEQKEIAEFITNYSKASIRGDMNEIMSYFHADFSAWGYSVTEVTEPLDLDATQKTLEEFYKSLKILIFDIKPLAIQIQGDISIAHLTFKETISDANGVEDNMSGPWTAVLLKQGKGWTFLCWTWVYLDS